MELETIEDALADALPAIEDLMELCGQRVDPSRAAATIAGAQRLLSTVESKIAQAEASLS